MCCLTCHLDKLGYTCHGSPRFHRAASPAPEPFLHLHVDALGAWQGGSEKLSDEAIEESLEKVVKLLAYISDKDLFAGGGRLL